MAAKAGAAYVSPFVGRLDDISHDGMEIVEQIITISAIMVLKRKSLSRA